MFSIVQRALLPVLVSLPSFIILYTLYRFGKRSLPVNETFNDRLDYAYSFSAAALLSQFLFQALPNATGPTGPQIGAFVGGFAMVGFFIMLCMQKWQRVNHWNPYYISSAESGNSVEIISSLDHEKIELVEYHHVTDLESEQVARDRLELQDEAMELKKRRRLAALVLIVMTILCVLKGFFLVYREASWFTWVFYIVDKWVETGVVGITMLHAFFHASAKTPRAYLYCSLAWVVCGCIGSTIPAVVPISQLYAALVANHLATSICYAFTGGFLFWIALYYNSMERKRVDKRDVLIELSVFGATAGLGWITGYFF